MPVDPEQVEATCAAIDKIRKHRKVMKRKIKLADITPDVVKERRLMMDVAMAAALTPQRAYRIARRIAAIAEEDPDPQAVIAAAKFLYERALGKPKQYIETNQNQTLTIEQRTQRVLAFFGIQESDAALQFGTKEGKQLAGRGEERRAPALPARVLDRYEPKDSVEEIEADRDNVGECPQEQRGEGDGPGSV